MNYKDNEHGKTESLSAYAPSLRQIRRARSHLMVCFWTFPLYVWAITTLLGAGRDITWIMVIYMVLYAVFGINASVKRCPRCQGQFFVKKFFLNPLRKSCAHCDLHLDHAHGDPT